MEEDAKLAKMLEKEVSEEIMDNKAVIFLYSFITLFSSFTFFIIASISKFMNYQYIFPNDIVPWYVYMIIAFCFLIGFIYYERKNHDMFMKFLNTDWKMELIVDLSLSVVFSIIYGLTFPYLYWYPVMLLLYLISLSH